MNFPAESKCQATLPNGRSSSLAAETIEDDLNEDTRPLVIYDEPPPPYYALPPSESVTIAQQPERCPQPTTSQIIRIPNDREIKIVSLTSWNHLMMICFFFTHYSIRDEDRG